MVLYKKVSSTQQGDGSSTVRKYYFSGVQRIAMRDNGTLYYLSGDHLGSTGIKIDASGNKVGELRSKPWGETRYTWGSTVTNYQYTGQRNDTDAGLYYYNARWYDSSLGRFLQPDTLIPSLANPQSWNRFSYVSNNPIRYNDPTGHRPAEDGPTPPIISYNKEDGLCIIGNCIFGAGYARWQKKWWNEVQVPRIKENVDIVGDVIGLGFDTKDYWTSTETPPKIGFGLDVVTQLIKDSNQVNLTWDQRLARAGLNGLEGAGISAISAKVATKSSQAVLGPSISLAVKIEHPLALAIPPAAVALTWVTTYVATNWALSYVADKVVNENIPYINP